MLKKYVMENAISTPWEKQFPRGSNTPAVNGSMFIRSFCHLLYKKNQYSLTYPLASGNYTIQTHEFEKFEALYSLQTKPNLEIPL